MVSLWEEFEGHGEADCFLQEEFGGRGESWRSLERTAVEDINADLRYFVKTQVGFKKKKKKEEEKKRVNATFFLFLFLSSKDSTKQR